MLLRDRYDSGFGNMIIGNYATEGLGAILTEDMRRAAYPAKVVFGNSTSIAPADNYYKVYVQADAETGVEAFNYYHYYNFKVFYSFLKKPCSYQVPSPKNTFSHCKDINYNSKN